MTSLNQLHQLVSSLESDISHTVFGHKQTTRYIIGSFLVGGHVLLEGVPGIGKTLLARTFANVTGLSLNRIQFTPDLMPTDVTGVNIFDKSSSTFRFVPGPIFADVVLADEINRTPPKTQAALLEAMEERFATIDGERHSLGDLFFVIATQNPIEHEGTYPLPEAQLDRFLVRLRLGYPTRERERSMIEHYSAPPVAASAAVPEEKSHLDSSLREQYVAARQELRSIELAPAVSDYILRIIEGTRTHESVSLGASPRAGLHLALAAKFEAACAERRYVTPDDVKTVAAPVLNHRLILSADSFDSVTTDEVIEDIVSRTGVPANIIP